MEWAHIGPPMAAAFLASLVEFVEALTVVLAVGVTRGWRSALAGTGGALALLLVLVVALGPALQRIPLQGIQLAVGTLLLLFGLRWLRKAILRAAGIIPLHDELVAFAKETAALGTGLGMGRGAGWDREGLMTAFKIVMVEGIEVVFIVIAVGATGGLLVPAAVGALGALAVVVALGVALHRPIARIPENALKFMVGGMLSGFGAFWVGEGLGLAWPASDFALVMLSVGFLVAGLAIVPLCRMRTRVATAEVSVR